MVSLATDTRKRLGQFFTREPLARLLAALGEAVHSDSMIDPMSGSGNMVAAVLSLNPNASAAAIEIEPVAARMAAERFGDGVSVIQGSAFDPDSWADLRPAWDLVITNPPYVRYQLGSTERSEDFVIPSADQIRAGLVELIGSNTTLNAAEREAFLHCARSYSGLADVAVPSWLLCASKVVAGGRLAVLVPNTWLSRDYAAPVLFILRRFFEIEYVVEDKDMAWFSDSLVRTTLVVARRTEDKGTAFAPGSHLRFALSSALADGRSIVGAAFPDSNCPELDFANASAAVLAGGRDGIVAGTPAQMSDESDLIEALRNARTRIAWPCTVEIERSTTRAVPERLRRAIPRGNFDLVTVGDLGWKVGQGLRTGANDFFYVTRIVEGRFASPLLPGEELSLPEDAVVPAVRRQAEVPHEGEPAVAEPTSSNVLVLDRWALPEDMESAEGPKPWRPMDGDLARLTRAAAMHAYARGKRTVLLPSLSAVRTNVRAGSNERQRPARFWYHLPSLAPRHQPSLYLARVNGRRALTFVNNDDRVIDANFSTLWPAARGALSAEVMLALLRSSWADIFLEVTGTVLGGGALKVEASHLRRLAFPRPTENAIDTLQQLGNNLVLGLSDGPSLDNFVVGLLDVPESRSTAERMRTLAAELYGDRARKAKMS